MLKVRPALVASVHSISCLPARCVGVCTGDQEAKKVVVVVVVEPDNLDLVLLPDESVPPPCAAADLAAADHPL